MSHEEIAEKLFSHRETHRPVPAGASTIRCSPEFRSAPESIGPRTTND